MKNPQSSWEALSEEDKKKTPKPNGDLNIKKYLGVKDEDGMGTITHVMGSKYPLRGCPTGPALSRLAPIKALINKIIVSRLSEFISSEIPYDQLSRPVRVLSDVFDDLINAEKLEGHKKEWRAWKKLLTYFFENDFPYRYKMQWLVERLAKRLNEIKLDEADKYHFRVKNFRVDLDEDWRDLVRQFPKLKDQKTATAFKKILYDGQYADTCYGNNASPADLFNKFISTYEQA